MKRSLTPEVTADVLSRLSPANLDFARRYPGEPSARQPVHTVYGGAHLFAATTAAKLGRAALTWLDENFAAPQAFAATLGLRADPASIYARVRQKLEREPVEDFRVDFEDGYGYRADAEEDGHALGTAEHMGAALAAGTLPPFSGLRIKALTGESQARAVRTLDLFLTRLVDVTHGRLPPGFVVTLPKVQMAAQVTTLCALLDGLEAALELVPGSIRCELMIETPQAIVGPAGEIAVLGLVRAARGRCVAVHFGAYDYTAALNITAAYQTLAHPACDIARHLMQAALAGTGVALCDSVTSVLPLPRHKVTAGAALGEAEQRENRETIAAAAKLHYDNIRRGLEHGLYRSWDLHPAQLPLRYAALYSFFAESQAAASRRLKHFLSTAAQATALGEVFDDAATGQGLLNFFLRGLACGALGAADVAQAGLSAAELETRSFAAIAAMRRASPT